MNGRINSLIEGVKAFLERHDVEARIKNLWFEARRNRNFMVGACMVLSVLLIAIFAGVIAPYGFDCSEIANRVQSPCWIHIFGTDDLGRDVFSRVIFGTRIALRVALLCTAIEVAIGVAFGLVSGYFGGAVDRALTFIADITWSVPAIIMAMAVISILGKGIDNTIIAIALVSWAQYTRTVRAKTLSLKNMAFIETGVAFGERKSALLLRYILPNVLNSVIVLISMSLPAAITATSALSFLGLGAQPPSPDWGLAISDGLSKITVAPWLSVFPGLALVYTVFGFNLLGEGIRDLLDPRMRAM